MEKDLTEIKEEIEGLRNEVRNTLDALKEIPKGNSNNSELENLKRVVGNFHPSANSPTYRELNDNCNSLKKENETLKKKLAELNDEVAVLRKHKSDALPSNININEDEKNQTMSLLFNQAFTDAQIKFLSSIEKTLPTEAFKEIANPRLTPERMKIAYSLMCSKYHIKNTVKEEASDNIQDSESESKDKPNLILADVNTDTGNNGNMRIKKIAESIKNKTR